MSIRVGMSYRLPEYYDYLRRHGFEVAEVRMLRNDEDETIEKMRGFEAIAAMVELYNARVLDALKDHLKILVRHGIGYDRVDIAHAAQVGICCCNSPGAMSSGVAETTLAMMLECTRQVFKRDREIKGGGWSRGPVTNQLEGSTVRLVGFGNIARRVAQYLQGFRCRILAHDVRSNEAAHAATNTHACIRAGFDGIIQAFREFQEGKVPRFCLNPTYVENARVAVG